ncbi:hypothetical protein Hamer_G016363 [Homarus americanus]|uniref:Uncharacterized protein n=1 Tax=Homarus americanus TaxID=6706 RepID=A0A8J5JUM7_HOMAM|nr:hypothetical protein Hamer_G016363 [Homarus americanus]
MVTSIVRRLVSTGEDHLFTVERQARQELDERQVDAATPTGGQHLSAAVKGLRHLVQKRSSSSGASTEDYRSMAVLLPTLLTFKHHTNKSQEDDHRKEGQTPILRHTSMIDANGGVLPYVPCAIVPFDHPPRHRLLRLQTQQQQLPLDRVHGRLKKVPTVVVSSWVHVVDDAEDVVLLSPRRAQLPQTIARAGRPSPAPVMEIQPQRHVRPPRTRANRPEVITSRGRIIGYHEAGKGIRENLSPSWYHQGYS